MVRGDPGSPWEGLLKKKLLYLHSVLIVYFPIESMASERSKSLGTAVYNGTTTVKL